MINKYEVQVSEDDSFYNIRSFVKDCLELDCKWVAILVHDWSEIRQVRKNLTAIYGSIEMSDGVVTLDDTTFCIFDVRHALEDLRGMQFDAAMVDNLVEESVLKMLQSRLRPSLRETNND